MPGSTPQPTVGVTTTYVRAGEVTIRSRVYEIKIRGVASDLVRAEFDDVEVWEAPGVTWLRTGEADTATLYGLIRRTGPVIAAWRVAEGEQPGPPGAGSWHGQDHGPEPAGQPSPAAEVRVLH